LNTLRIKDTSENPRISLGQRLRVHCHCEWTILE
jgi:hypothetical protein